ncbi:MAG: GNAT family N-acetyltransferase [Elainellaceae cyanobacterium]
MTKAVSAIVRQAKPTDYEGLCRLFLAPDINQWTLGLPKVLIAQSIQRFMHPTEDDYVLVACVGQQIVGSLELRVYISRHKHHSAAISTIAVSVEWQRHGIGSQLMRAAIDLADYWLGLHRLESLIYTDNYPAIRLLNTFQFEVEGTFRHFTFRSDAYADVHLMARLRNDVSRQVQHGTADCYPSVDSEIYKV